MLRQVRVSRRLGLVDVVVVHPRRAARAALELVRATPALPARVGERMTALSGALDVPAVAGAVLSVPMPSPQVQVSLRTPVLSRTMALSPVLFQMYQPLPQ